MKKALTILAGALIVPLLSSQAWADDSAAEAKSVNAVGVVKYTIPANGQFTCIALPLNPLETSDSQGRWVWGETSIADQLPDGSDVYFWTGTSWKSYTKDPDDHIWPGGARRRAIEPGEAIFVRGPASVTNSFEVSLLGELPTEDTVTYAVSGGNGYDVFGVTPYPVQGNFGSTSISTNLPDGSDVYFWTGTSWKSYTKDPDDHAWPGGAQRRQYTVGEGIFIKVPGNTDSVVNDRPFAWE